MSFLSSSSPATAMIPCAEAVTNAEHARRGRHLGWGLSRLEHIPHVVSRSRVPFRVRRYGSRSRPGSTKIESTSAEDHFMKKARGELVPWRRPSYGNERHQLSFLSSGLDISGLNEIEQGIDPEPRSIAAESAGIAARVLQDCMSTPPAQGDAAHRISI